MITTASIKLTGALARTGRHGRIRFQVCDRKTQCWTPATFPPEQPGGPTWLVVDDAIFTLAVGVYLMTPARERIASAELELREGCGCGSELLVADVLALWLDDASVAGSPAASSPAASSLAVR
jgi:hypothetical protein